MIILVVAAHPDDEVLGCGGTIAKLAREGHEANIAVLGEGVTSRYDSPGSEARAEVRKLRETSSNVAKMLGAKQLFTYEFPDNRFDTVPLLDIVKTVEDLIDRLKPHSVYTHHAGDLNIDHNITHRAVMTASRPVEECSAKEILAFEVPSSTEWAFGQFRPGFSPNVFVDISDTLETKLKAMETYTCEARVFPHPRSKEALEALARYRGSTVGLQNAEAFELIRSIVRN